MFHHPEIFEGVGASALGGEGGLGVGEEILAASGASVLAGAGGDGSAEMDAPTITAAGSSLAPAVGGVGTAEQLGAPEEPPAAQSVDGGIAPRRVSRVRRSMPDPLPPLVIEIHGESALPAISGRGLLHHLPPQTTSRAAPQAPPVTAAELPRAELVEFREPDRAPAVDNAQPPARIVPSPAATTRSAPVTAVGRSVLGAVAGAGAALVIPPPVIPQRRPAITPLVLASGGSELFGFSSSGGVIITAGVSDPLEQPSWRDHDEEDEELIILALATGGRL